MLQSHFNNHTMRIAVCIALLVALCLFVDVDAGHGGRSRGRGRSRGGGGGRRREKSSSVEDGAVSSSEECGRHRKGRAGPFGLCGVCEVRDGAGVAVVDVKKAVCVAPDTCFTDTPKAVLADGAGAVFRQLFVCAAQKDKTLEEIIAECQGDCMPDPPVVPDPAPGPGPVPAEPPTAVITP